MTKQEIYREMLHVVLGPFGKQMHQKSGPGKAKVLMESLKVLPKLLKDRLLYGQQQIIGDIAMEGKTWLMVGSKNNLDSLDFLRGKLPESIFVATNKKILKYGNFPRVSLHHALSGWTGIPTLWHQLKPTFGDMLIHRCDQFLKSIGQLEAASEILKKYEPKALLFSNDHVPEMRAFILAARELQIPSIYLQHASVSELFPPLRFSLSLLEGQDSLEKYRKCGPVEGRVELIGMPKFDEYLPYRNQSQEVRNIGICANVVDEQQRLENALNRLVSEFPGLDISFRPHPRDERSFNLPPGVKLSRSSEEKIFDYLRSQDMIIAGDTSTHLEAVLLNVMSIYFPFNDSFADYYGYVRNGLVEKADDLDQLIGMIRKYQNDRPSVLNRASRYNAVIGTEWDGRSSELAVKYIREQIDAD